jgi:hypothetical protein
MLGVAVGRRLNVDHANYSASASEFSRTPYVRRPGLFDFPFTTRMPTFAINVRSLFHSRTLCTAIFSRRDLAGTDGMGAFLALIKCHLVSPFIKSAEGLDVRQQRKAACQTQHFARWQTLVVYLSLLAYGWRVLASLRAIREVSAFVDLKFAHLQYRSSLLDEGGDVIFCKHS